MRHHSPLAVAIALVPAFASVPCLQAQAVPPGVRGAERVFAESPSVWFEAYGTSARVSPDGRTAIYSGRIIDLQHGREIRQRDWPRLTPQRRAAFGPRGALVRFGTSDGKTGWFALENGRLALLPLPPDATPEWSPNGRQVAFLRQEVTDSIFAGALGHTRGYPVAGPVTGFAWLPNGAALMVLSLEPSGISLLSRLDLADGTATVVARDLDAPTLGSSPVAVAPDGRHLYVALAGPGAPDPEIRHQPSARRWLGIWEVDLATGARRPVVPASGSGDAFAPRVASGYLYWTRAESDGSVVVVPALGGSARLVMRHAEVPSWRPDGRQIGFVSGEWRWVDWAIDLDGGAVDVNRSGEPVGPPQAIITGYHEDFEPVWSPRGGWVAYHSHRASTAVPTYLAPGSSDDIWLRRVGAPARDPAEIRLTDFGWEAGSPDWSPDGTRLVFSSYERGGEDGVSVPYLVKIDTATGHVVEHRRMPLPPEIHNALWAAWSPVRDELALEEDLGGGRHALWIAASDGSAARKVTEYSMPTFGGVSWMPDAQALVYSALSGGRLQLFTIPAAGGTPRQLTHDPANIFTPAVSPDGRLIAATRVLHQKEIWRMPLPR